VRRAHSSVAGPLLEWEGGKVGGRRFDLDLHPSLLIDNERKQFVHAVHSRAATIHKHYTNVGEGYGTATAALAWPDMVRWGEIACWCPPSRWAGQRVKRRGGARTLPFSIDSAHTCQKIVRIEGKEVREGSMVVQCM